MSRQLRVRPDYLAIDPMKWTWAEREYEHQKGCADCKRRIIGYHYFMVNDDLWGQYGEGGGYLCLTCTEKRIGRPLTRADFTDFADALINNKLLQDFELVMARVRRGKAW